MISLGIFVTELRKINKIKSTSSQIFKFKKKSKLKEEIYHSILENLDSWEMQNGFLDNTITLQSLAKVLNTNTSYLSSTINTLKGKNFACYLKNVRINYAINHIMENPKIIKSKSMIQIAEMYGFNSTGVFTQAFKEKIGVTPGVFFKRISA